MNVFKQGNWSIYTANSKVFIASKTLGFSHLYIDKNKLANNDYPYFTMESHVSKYPNSINDFLFSKQDVGYWESVTAPLKYRAIGNVDLLTGFVGDVRKLLKLEGIVIDLEKLINSSEDFSGLVPAYKLALETLNNYHTVTYTSKF